MKFKEYKNEEEFLAENEEELLLAEDINNTMLGLLPQVEKDKFFFRIENDDKVLLIGLITKTERKGLVFYAKDVNVSIDVYEFLVDEIISRNIELKEIKAPKGIAEVIFYMYSKKHNATLNSTRNLYLMKLKELPNNIDLKYTLRKADINDIEFEHNIVFRIAEETLGIEMTEERAYEVAKTYIEMGLYFLVNENGEMLSQAATTRTTKNGYTIGAVYTPIEKRRQGYARECLYRLLTNIIEDNKEVVVLYSNVMKPGNRALYESLGFEIIFEETILKF
jgi:hypothetical protein